MKLLVISYILRLFPAIIGLVGTLINSTMIFYIGGIICLSVHFIFFFRESLRPILFIIIIYLVSFLILMNFEGIILGAIVSTFFEMLYHSIKTFIAFRKIKNI